MSYQVVIPVIISFVISAVLGPIVIPFLRKLKVGQTEREELKSHLKKTGTPTMGGIIILASVILTSLIYVKDYPKIIPILFVTVGFGIKTFRWSFSMAENDLSDRDHGNFCILYPEIYGCITDDADPVFRWKIFRSRCACNPGHVLSSDRNRQWSELYGWSRWFSFQCHGIGSNLLFRGGSRYTQWD